jgi:hypothetical protein
MLAPMNVSAPPFSYITRANALEYEAIWRLGADALELTGGPTAGPDVTMRFPYKDVCELRLSFAPTRFDPRRYRCEVRMRSGQRVAIMSTHYAGVGNFEDRAAGYVPFVRGLVARVASANPAARFRSGKRPLFYLLEHAFLLLMLVLLVLVLGLVGGAALSHLVLVKLGILLFYIPLMILYTRKNWPRRFDPRDIPGDVLPEPASE